MENISDWLLNTIRNDEKNGITSGWLEEKRFLVLPHMSRTLKHILEGGSVIVLTDEQREWFGDYIITHINQHHNGRPFFPIVQIKHLHDMIDSSSSVIVLTDEQREWFGDYIITHINQHHNGRPFFPIVQIKHLHDMIDSSSKDGGSFMPIVNMLDMMYSNYRFWYIGKNNARANFVKDNRCQQGWHWIFDENDIFSSTDEKLDYKLLNLFKLFERALLAAMLNKISLDI